MHPEITSRLAAQRRADLAREASMIRNARSPRRTSQPSGDRMSATTRRHMPRWLPRLLPSLAGILARAATRLSVSD